MVQAQKLVRFFLVAALVCWLAGAAEAAVEWDIQSTLEIGATPVDVAVSANGQYTFVLTDVGTVYIYTADGELQDSINAGPTTSGIGVSPNGDKLFLTDGQKKVVRIVNLAFIADIRTEGSPVRGPVDAPVTIAVFSDFQ